MRCLVDVGNTRLKWVIERDGVRLRFGAVSLGCDSEIESFFEKELSSARVNKVLVSSVNSSSINDRISRWSSDKLGVEPQFAKVRKSYAGITVAYEDIRNLGVDRWLAMLGAWSKHKAPCAVVDAGSAITVDYIDEKGLHLGGLIVPGVSLMRRALFNETASVKVDALTLPQNWQPGCDTLPCVANGLSAMLRGFVDEVSARSEKVLLTGGDADVVSPLFAKKKKVEMHEHLVIDGLMCLV